MELTQLEVSVALTSGQITLEMALFSLESDLKTVLLEGSVRTETSTSITESLQRFPGALPLCHKLAEEIIDLDISQLAKERNKDLEFNYRLCMKIIRESGLETDGLVE